MSNAGFSAVVNYWGTISGLTPKSSNDGRTSALAESPSEYGDTLAHDVYADVIAPSTEYAVSDEVTAFPDLGTVFTTGSGATQKYIMLTTISVVSQAGTPPTVTLSGVQVESGSSNKRTYSVGTVSLKPRSKAQDIAGAFTASNKFTQINTTFSVDPHVETVKGVPLAGDASHGRIEVQATMTDGDGNGAITASSTGGFTVTTVPSENDPDSNYITRAATATKFLEGEEAA